VAGIGTREASTLAEVRGGAVAGRRTGEKGGEEMSSLSLSLSESTEREDGPCW